MPLGGMSGAPVLVGSNVERAAIGLIRWNPTRLDNPTLPDRWYGLRLSN